MRSNQEGYPDFCVESPEEKRLTLRKLICLMLSAVEEKFR
jgi:hypothetical protein